MIDKSQSAPNARLGTLIIPDETQAATHAEHLEKLSHLIRFGAVYVESIVCDSVRLVLTLRSQTKQ